MTELLKSRDRRAAAVSLSATMTCDVPVVQARGRRAAGVAAPTCRPTGRSPQSRGEAARAALARPASNTRPARSVPVAAPVADERSITGTPPIAARRRWAAGLLVGLTLAAVVAVLGVVGEDYETAATGAPSATQVVHVRSGESLTSLAERIAPEVPVASVIATVRDLNDLDVAGLRPGQALVVPDYR